MEFIKKYRQEAIVGFLILANILVWLALYERRPSDQLSVYFFDVGQGDAIFIESPSRQRILIDGGRNRKILTELGKTLPFADRRIDVVIATHPDGDHIGGLPEVVGRYRVGAFIEPGVSSDDSLDKELRSRLENKKIPIIRARRGMTLTLGDGVRMEILFPITDVSNWETNRASVVSKLVYGEQEFLLTGDSPAQIESVLIALDGDRLDVDVLKAGHHGSRTSTSLEFAKITTPEYAVISAGRDNMYGHPHEEVLDNLRRVGAKILSTAELGTIVFKTDGKTLELK
ncbi:MAG: ComEC/Rec2 family competence protein [Minisyncoccia bacterium]